MRFFPPIVTGPIIIAIGLNLSSSAINNCAQNWWIAMVAIVIIIACQHLGQGHDQDHPHSARRHRLLRHRGHRLTRPSAKLSSTTSQTPSGSRFRSTRSETVFGLFMNGNVDSHLLSDLGHHHCPAEPCHHGRAHRRRFRNLLHLQPQLHRKPGSAPHPDGRRSGNDARSPLRRTCQHHLRRKHRRSRPQQDLRPARHPHRGNPRHAASPSARSSRQSSPPCPAAPSAASAWSSTV